MRFLLSAFVLMSVLAFSAAAPAALPPGNGPVTFFLPEDVSAGPISVVEYDAKGREIGRPQCRERLQVVDWPRVQMCREVSFTPSGKGASFRLEASRPKHGFKLTGSRNNLLSTGDFEKPGWWFGGENPVWKYVAGGRNGGTAMQFDLRRKNTGKHINAGTYPVSLLKLKDAGNLPAMMRIFVRTVSGAGQGDGITIRMRTFDANGKFAGDYASVWTVQGGANRQWVEHRRVFTEPLKAEAASLELYLCNLAPRDGVCLQFDDFEILPAKHIAPGFEVVTPTEEVYGGSDYPVTVRCGAYAAGKTGVMDVEIPFKDADGSSKTVPGMMVAADSGEAAAQKGKLTLKFVNAETGTVVLNRNTALEKKGSVTLNVQLPPGEYKASVTAEFPGKQSYAREWTCSIMEDPFAMD